MAKKKKKEKTPNKAGWDFFRVLRKLFKREKPKKSRLFRGMFLAVAILCLLIAGYGIYCASFNDKVYPNVLVAGVKVGGKAKNEAESALEKKFESVSQPIKLTYQDKNWELKPVDIKLSYNLNKTIDEVYSVGREKTFLERFWSRLKTIVMTNEIKPIYTYDAAALQAFVDKIASDVDVPEKDVTGVIKNNSVTFTKESNGLRVQKEKIKKSVIGNFDKLQSGEIRVTTAVSYPNVTSGDTEEARQQVSTMLQAKPTLKWQKGAINVDQAIFSDWIKFKSEKVAGEKSGYRLVAYLDDGEVMNYLKKIAKQIDVEPQNAKLAINNNLLTVTQPSVTGYAFDAAVSMPEIKSVVQAGEAKEIVLAVKEVQPDVTSENYQNLGIKEIVGTGATNFRGSSTSRVQNIANGTRIVSGSLIKPGEEFSAVKTIGNVDASTGFVLGLIIKDNKTQSEYGGGLCQVSSTLFRAALNTGLRITERANHAYRVSYYERDGDGKSIGPGLDSTIYGPHPDLRFVNDTGNYILVQGRVEGNKLTFDFWGTKDGRTSSVSAPVISNETPAPAPQYVNTDTLYVGQKEQIETAHPGATVVINYSVTKDGKEIVKQKFTSKYKPWAARYLVGTKPVPAAPAQPAAVQTAPAAQ